MAEEYSSTGISFFSLLTILFIGLKLTNHIDWNWWRVLSPLIFILFLYIILIIIIWWDVK